MARGKFYRAFDVIKKRKQTVVETRLDTEKENKTYLEALFNSRKTIYISEIPCTK